MVYRKLFHLSNMLQCRPKHAMNFALKWNGLCFLSTSRQQVCDKQLLLKENMRSYLDNHHYNLAAVEALSSYASVVKPELAKEISFSESFNSWNSSWSFFWHMDSDETKQDNLLSCITVSSTIPFEKGYDALERYTMGERLDPGMSAAFRALERFYKNKEIHESSLRHLRIKKLTDAEVASLLSKHLLEEFLPYPSNYYLDKYSRGKPDICPCGCGESIRFGLTQLGSPQLFYGTADIVLFPTNQDLFHADESASAVFTLKKNDLESFCHEVTEETWNDEVEDEVITTEEYERRDLGEADMQRQLHKQAISSSLCKLNSHLCNKANNRTSSDVAMVPVCGVTKSTYDVVMYDAENDFMLKMCDDSLEIFDGDSLRFSAIVDLWMIIHHNLFCSKLPREVLDKLKATCSLIPQLGEERFASIVENSKWLYQAEGTVQRPMRPLNQSTRHIIDKSVRKYPRSCLS